MKNFDYENMEKFGENTLNDIRDICGPDSDKDKVMPEARAVTLALIEKGFTVGDIMCFGLLLIGASVKMYGNEYEKLKASVSTVPPGNA